MNPAGEAAATAGKPWLNVTPTMMERMSISVPLMAIGMFYLVTGRQQANLGRMMTGAVLSLASVALFSL